MHVGKQEDTEVRVEAMLSNAKCYIIRKQHTALFVQKTVDTYICSILSVSCQETNSVPLQKRL